jgi:hypothetical protein
MLLTTSLTLEPGDTAEDLVSVVYGKMNEANVRFVMEMYRSIYDETDPKQDTDEAGGLLWLDAQGNTLTQAQADAVLAGNSRALIRPKHRPRTLKETHVKFATSWTHSVWAVARARKSELDRRALQNPVPEKLPAVAVI